MSKTAAHDEETMPGFDYNRKSTRFAASDGHFLSAATGVRVQRRVGGCSCQSWFQKASARLVWAKNARGN